MDTMKNLLLLILCLLYMAGVNAKGFDVKGYNARADRYEFYSALEEEWPIDYKMHSLITVPAYGVGLKGVKYEGNIFIYPQYRDVMIYNADSYTQVKDDDGWFFVNLNNKPLFDERFDSILPFDFSIYPLTVDYGFSTWHFGKLSYIFIDAKKHFNYWVYERGYNYISVPSFQEYYLGCEKHHINSFLPDCKQILASRLVKHSDRRRELNLIDRMSVFPDVFLFIAKKNGLWGIADPEGKWLVEPKYARIEGYLKTFAQFPHMWFFYATNEDGTTDIIDILGHTVRHNVGNPAKDLIKNRKKHSRDKSDKLSKSELREYTDTTKVIALLDMLDSLMESSARVLDRLDTIRPHVKLFPVKNKSNKWGFVNKDNNLIVDYQYDEILDKGASAAYRVCKNGKYGIRNFRGEVIPCIFDFINLWDSVGNSTAIYAANNNGEIRYFEAEVNEWGFCDLTLKRYLSAKFDEVYAIDSTNYCNLDMLAYYIWNEGGRTSMSDSAIIRTLNASRRHSNAHVQYDAEAFAWNVYARWDTECLNENGVLPETSSEMYAKLKAEREAREAAQPREDSFTKFLNSFLDFTNALYSTVQTVQQNKEASSYSASSSSAAGGNKQSHGVHPGMSQGELQKAYNDAISNIAVIRDNWHKYVGSYAEVSQKDNLRSIKATIARIKRQAAEHGVSISTNSLENWEPK